MTFKAYPREHGTDRGYQQHRTRGDLPACEPCKAAHVLHNQAAKDRRRAERNRTCHACGQHMPTVPAKHRKTCPECGLAVTGGRRTYCSDECKRVARNARDRNRMRGPDDEPDVPDKPVRWVKRGLILVPVEALREAS